MAESDRDVVERAKGGDAEAFAELVRRHGPRVRRLARSLVRGDADADDLAQEAFVRAHQALPRFDGRSEFFTWIYRIAVNLSLNHARAQRVRKGVSVDEPGVESAIADVSESRISDPEKILNRQRMARALVEEVEKLPDGLRVTLSMVCLEGMPQDEVAEVLGCSTGTIGWRVHEARRRLREALAARGLTATLDDLSGGAARGKGDR